MQKLSERNTCTPTDIPHVRGDCGPSLNSPDGERGGAAALKTFDNNPDAALTAAARAERDLRVPVVYVLNMRGEPLMPCKPGKARILLKQGKAKVVGRTPFAIQLKHATGETTQPVALGVDSGFKHVGLSAVTEKQEVYAGEVRLRTDIVDLNSERRQYRRSRRNRKTWYRKPRFSNRGNKSKGWLAPSIRHKLDSHVKIVNQIKSILPVARIIVEVAAFDIQKIKNPDIDGELYQRGEQSGFWNAREYVLHRDNHACRHCKGKSKDKILNVHHIESRKTGGDRPTNLITLCETCHGKYHRGEIDLKVEKSDGFKAETFMTTVRWKLIDRLREAGDNVGHTYGCFTKRDRIKRGISKSHANDAFVVAGGTGQDRIAVQYRQKQVRKCNRKLFKGVRSHVRNTAPRFVEGFQRFDKVLWNGVECFVFGRRKTGYFDLRKLDDTKIHASAKAKDCVLIESARTLLIERRDAVSSPA